MLAQRLFYKRFLWNLGHKELSQNIPFAIHARTEVTVAECARPGRRYGLVIWQQFDTHNSPRFLLQGLLDTPPT